MTGGYLCLSENIKDRYTLGKLIGKGGEGTVYLNHDDPTTVIKKFSQILVADPRHKKRIKEYQRVFRISKLIGDMGIGPKVYYYKVCKQLITVNFNDGPNVRPRTAAIFPFGSKEVKIIRDPNITEFSYEAYIPYLVMENIEGHEITEEELENPEYMSKVYEMYLQLYSNHIAFGDIHTGNIIVGDKRLYFIDFSTAHSLKKMPKMKTIEELKYDILEHMIYNYETTPLSETSIDSQVSQAYSL